MTLIGMGVWKNIKKGWVSFSQFTRFVVGHRLEDQLLA
jgi:hypothetical protein